MQESSKSFLIKDLLRDLVHTVDSSASGIRYIALPHTICVISVISEITSAVTNVQNNPNNADLRFWLRIVRESQVPHYFRLY